MAICEGLSDDYWRFVQLPSLLSVVSILDPCEGIITQLRLKCSMTSTWFQPGAVVAFIEFLPYRTAMALFVVLFRKAKQ